MLLSLAAAAPGLFTCIAHGLATHGLALHGSMAHIGQQLVPCSLLSFISGFIFICPTLRPLLACGFWSLSSPPALLAYNLLGQEGLVMSRQEGLRFFVMWPASLSSASNFHSSLAILRLSASSLVANRVCCKLVARYGFLSPASLAVLYYNPVTVQIVPSLVVSHRTDGSYCCSSPSPLLQPR